MGSPSPIEIISTASIDVPDAVLCRNLQNVVGAAEVREQFVSVLTVDNGNVKHVASRAPAYPGQAKQIVVASENGVVRIVQEVGGPLDEPTAKLRQPGPSTSGERALEKDRRSSMIEAVAKGKVDVGQRETSDFRSDTGIPGVDVDRANKDREVVVKIQPGPFNPNGLALEEGSGRGTVGAKGKEMLDLRPKTEIVDVDLGSSDSCGTIVNIQPGASSSGEVASKESRRSLTESVAKGRATVGQREVSDVRFKTEMAGTGLGSSDDREVIMQSEQLSSSELRLRECCWPTRADAATDRVEDDGKIIGISSSGHEPRRIVDKVDLSQADHSGIALVQSSALVVERGNGNVNSEEVSLKKDFVHVGADLVRVDDVVKVQPGHLSHSVIIGKEDHSSRIGKSEAKLDEGQANSEYLDKNGKEFDPEGIAGDSCVFDNRGVGSRRETADFELDKTKHVEIKATASPLNVSMTSLDGRHECALSDFSVDKEDYRLSQYGSEEDEGEEDKLMYSAKLSLTDDQTEDTMYSTIDFANDSKSDANIQIIGMTARKSHEDTSKSLTTDEELQSPDERLPLETEEERTRSVGKVEQTEEASRTVSGDPSSEIDGKYRKSIVNSRKSPRKVKEDQIHDTELKEAMSQQELQSEALENSSIETKSSRKVKQGQTVEVGADIENKDQIVNDQKVSCSGEVFQSSLKTASTKTKSSAKVGVGENVSQKFSTVSSSSTKSPKKLKDKQIFHKSGEMRDYDRSINDRVISQLEKVFQNSTKKSSTKTIESPKRLSDGCVETRNQTLSIHQPAENRQAGEEAAQHSSKISFTESPRKAQGQKTVKVNDKKKVADDKTKQDLNEIKDVYTRKVRRYNVPLQGSLDSMIVSDETFAPKPKKDDTFSKKSKSYESIKRIQEVFLGTPGKMSNSGSQLDIPDEFCSICCYMNEITFRTEEEISSPNQETFYTLRSTCSSLADDDDSTECDICGSLNQQEAADALEGKILVDSAHGEIPCELCRICGEVDGSYDPNTMIPGDRYAFRLVEPSQDDDDSFEIENCGFQSGTESADDRSRVSEKESVKEESDRSKSRSLFIHGSSMTRDQPRELYFIPKDEIAILTSGAKKVGRKGSLFRKKEDLSVRDNRRYSSVDSLQLAKMSAKVADKALKVAKNPALVASADNLRISRRGSRRSKSLQRSADDADRRGSLTDNLNSLTEGLVGKEEDAAQTSADPTQKLNARDKEAVKMILTQHGIKIISEKETAL